MTHHSTVALPGNPNMSQYVDRRFRGACCLHHQGDETSVDIYLTTRQYIPEDSELHTRRRENVKSRNC
jgi:hypothetical protein